MSSLIRKNRYSNFYRTLDGVYSSFWLGKITNLLSKAGSLSTIEKHILGSWLVVKVQQTISPLSYMLECLLKTKPIFNLGSTVVRGKEKQYPILLSYHKQLQLSCRWASSLIVERKERSLGHRIYSELLNISDEKHHVLIQRRDKIFKSIMKSRSNLRFLK